MPISGQVHEKEVIGVSREITKDADKMLCEIYATYLSRRSDGMPKAAAADFSDESEYPEAHKADWLSQDGRATLRELKQARFVSMDIIGGFSLEASAIVYMENRFRNGLSDVLDFLGKIRSAIPFV